MDDQVVFTTPWFEIVARRVEGDGAPHYALTTDDYVSVVALTRDGRLILVRQYRPAVRRTTLELPSGHVDEGESPEAAARRELREETGYVADAIVPLGHLSPDTGRMANRMWCFFAGDCRPAIAEDDEPEAGIEPLVYDGDVARLVADPEFDCALNFAVLLLAVARGHLPNDWGTRPGTR